MVCPETVVPNLFGLCEKSTTETLTCCGRAVLTLYFQGEVEGFPIDVVH